MGTRDGLLIRRFAASLQQAQRTPRDRCQKLLPALASRPV